MISIVFSISICLGWVLVDVFGVAPPSFTSTHILKMSWYSGCQHGWLQMSTFGSLRQLPFLLQPFHSFFFINKGIFLFCSFGWLDKHRFWSFSFFFNGVNSFKLQTLLDFFPVFCSAPPAMYCTPPFFWRLHSRACDVTPPWDLDPSWPAWCAACFGFWDKLPKNPGFFQQIKLSK